MSDQDWQEDTALGDWVYCVAHLRPHKTGFCVIGVDGKLGLGSFSGAPDEQVAKAVAKCQRFGLPLFSHSDPRTQASLWIGTVSIGRWMS